MKKVFFSSLMVLALSTMAFAQQSKQPSKPMQPQVSKPATQQPAQQPSTQANAPTQKKSTTMTKPKHRKTHRAKKHHTTK